MKTVSSPNIIYLTLPKKQKLNLKIKLKPNSITNSKAATFINSNLKCVNTTEFYKLEIPKKPENSAHHNPDKCENLLTNGHWSKFIKCGIWERYHKSANGSMETITDTFNQFWLSSNWWGRKEGYPCYDHKTAGCSHWPPYYFWHEQNYKGTWASNDACSIKRLNKVQLKKCFENGANSIAVIGDSIGRQLYRSVLMYLKEEYECCFYDSGDQPGRPWSEYVKDVATTYFFWNTLPSSYEYRLNSTDSIINLQNMPDLKLMIVSPNLVWPLGKISNKWNPEIIRNLMEVELDRLKWIDGLIDQVRSFVNGLLKTKQYDKEFKIYLLAQHLVFRTGHNQAWYQVFTKEYNTKLGEMVSQELETGGSGVSWMSRVKYVDINLAITRSPDDGALLTPDGTHMMWTAKKYGKQGHGKRGSLPLSSAQLALLDIIFNNFCGARVDFGINACC